MMTKISLILVLLVGVLMVSACGGAGPHELDDTSGIIDDSPRQQLDTAPGIQLCVGISNNGGDGDLLTIIDINNPDPFTNEINIGIGTGTTKMDAIALNPCTGVLYGAMETNQGQIGTIDIYTGVFSPLRNRVGSGSGSLGRMSFNDIDGLAFDPETCELFASVQRPNAPDLFIQIDPGTGRAIADAFGRRIDYLVIDAMCMNEDLGDIAIDPYDSTIYATMVSGGLGACLVVIDRTSGEATLVDHITDDDGDRLRDVEGLGFDEDGDLFCVRKNGKFYHIDKGTGDGNFLMDLDNGHGDYESIECIVYDPYPNCGNGVIEGGEQCDDMGRENNDGCNFICLNERCGDGIRNGAEACDDGGTDNNDGCSAACVVERCGDGIVNNGNEECDGGDGCNAECRFEVVCGDGEAEGDEECDDNNTIDGDGCSADCRFEAACGNGFREGNEECDDNNTIDGDGCSASCNDEWCGDGSLNDVIEECDDGNTRDGDGCDANCRNELVCGDGTCEFDPEDCYSLADEEGSENDRMISVDINDTDLQTNEINIGGTGTTTMEGIAVNPCTGVLYGATHTGRGQLGTIDTTTGLFSPLRNEVGAGHGSLMDDAISFYNIEGLAFDPNTCELFASIRRTGPDLLIQIDPETGRYVRNSFGAGIDYLVMGSTYDNIWCLELDDVDDFVIDSHGTLYAVINSDARGDHLVIIDRETGAGTDLGPLGVNNMEGLTLDRYENLFGIRRGGSVGWIYVINKSTGAASRHISIDNATGKKYEALACPPEPPTEPEPPAEPRCGDGNVDRGEECDDGNESNTDTCTNSCTEAECGDGFVQPGEECDDGNRTNNDSCSNQCRVLIPPPAPEPEPPPPEPGPTPEPECGDGIKQDGEQCDGGPHCSTSCTIEPYCGDGTRQNGEQCDGGPHCRANCTIEPYCGDGTRQNGEQCDGGPHCSTSCTIEPYCGDGTRQNGEQCDGGPRCSTSCTIEPYCGDGTRQNGEQCDDGNTSNGDGCNSICRLEKVDEDPDFDFTPPPPPPPPPPSPRPIVDEDPSFFF